MCFLQNANNLKKLNSSKCCNYLPDSLKISSVTAAASATVAGEIEVEIEVAAVAL